MRRQQTGGLFRARYHSKSFIDFDSRPASSRRPAYGPAAGASIIRTAVAASSAARCAALRHGRLQSQADTGPASLPHSKQHAMH